MLTNPTLDLLHALGLHGMAQGYKALEANPESRSLDHAEWLGLLLDHESTLRQQKRFETRARTAHLRHPASIEDVDYRAHRGLDRALFLKLAACDWIRTRRNLIITGPCGVGKSWLACALAVWMRNLLGTCYDLQGSGKRVWIGRFGAFVRQLRFGGETLAQDAVG